MADETKARRLSLHLLSLLALPEEEITLGKALDRLGDRGPALFALVFSLPFSQPVPLPGLSTPIGIAQGYMGLALLLNRPPWLPDFIRRRKIGGALFVRMIGVVVRVLDRVERWVRPRGGHLQRFPLYRRILGLMIALCGLLLALPLPVPFSNFFPGMTVSLLCLAILEDDGLALLLGHLFFVATVVYFSMLVALPLLGARFAHSR